MSSLMETLLQSLGGDATREISRKVGADEGSVSKVVTGALPLLLGALTRNSNKPEGARALLGALDRDHDGSILDDLAGFLGKGPTADGNGILKHALGGRQQAVESGLGKASGLPTESIGKILAMLAPVVMGALGKEKKSKGFDSGGLSQWLGNEEKAVASSRPEALGIVGKLLDSDGDGDVTDDLLKLGGGLLGSLFGGKK